jgi:hypothetical protein
MSLPLLFAGIGLTVGGFILFIASPTAQGSPS